jgi:glycosyltransferase involved in cell wall biosynthesis
VKSTNVQAGLTSIIVPCWNQLEFTRHCVNALRRYTRQPWELVVVDNGSTDGTRDYLAGVQDMSPVPVRIVANNQNLGFPAAINQGLRLAHGEYLVLLNNDVVVTEGWLDHLIALANATTHFTAEGERLDLTIIDFNEMGAKSADRLTPGHCPPPPQAPPSQGGEKICSPTVGIPPSVAGPLAPPSQGGEKICWSSLDVGPVVGSRAASRRGPRRLASTIGLVGPMSNYAAPPQLVEGVPYSDLEEMHRFARRWRDEHRGQWLTVAKLSGFCLLMKRAVYDAIGALDERFGLGLFDDDDLAERARRAGFELAVAHDLFVHHFGSRTFVGNGVDAEKLLDENEQRFTAKWGLPRINGTRVALKPFPNQPRNDPDVAGPEQPRLEPFAARSAAKTSLTMIVRNEQENLPHCLRSVEGVFDEIIVVDTGSTDRTVEIARSFGAKVFDFVWVDDFAAARNAALARATGDYAFWLDADDVVDPPQRRRLEALLDRLRTGDESAYVVRCACDPSPDGTGGETVVDHIRLFPLRPDVRWTYRVHEQILPALRRAKVPVQWTDLTVRHTGYVDKALRARKLDRDTKILLQELEDRPDDPFTLFNLGSIAIERQDWNGALRFLRRSLAGSAPTDSIVRTLFALIARAHQMVGDSQAALRTCAEGLELDTEDAELWFRKAVVHRHRGESTEAGRCWRRILGLHRPDQFCSVDQGIYGHLTRRNLAALAAERGDRAEAERLWEDVLRECPGDPEALAKLRRPAPVEQTS